MTWLLALEELWSDTTFVYSLTAFHRIFKSKKFQIVYTSYGLLKEAFSKIKIYIYFFEIRPLVTQPT